MNSDSHDDFPPCERLSMRRRGYPKLLANQWLKRRGAKTSDDDGFYTIAEFSRLSGLSKQTLWRRAALDQEPA
jgi:hypothetical protein